MDVASNYKIQIDLIRIYAIMCVVVVHVVSPFLGYSPFFDTPTYWVANIIDAISRVGVPLFVMISGYLLLKGKSINDPFAFVMKRIRRIGLPLLYWCLIYFVWSRYFMHFESNTDSFAAQISQFFRGYYHMYFMYLILGLSLITPLLNKMLRNVSGGLMKSLTFGLFVVAMIVTAIKGFMIPSINIFETTLTYFIPYTAYYLVGYYFGNLETSGSSKVKIFFVYIFVLISTILLNYWYMRYDGWTQGYSTNLSTYFYFFENFSPTVVVMSLSIFVLAIKSRLVLPVSIVKVLSGAAFGVYLIHPMVIDVLNKYTLFDLSRIPSPVFIFMLIKSIVVILISYVVVLVLRKVNLFQHLDGSR